MYFGELVAVEPVMGLSSTEVGGMPKQGNSVLWGDDRLPQRFWDKVLPALDGCWEWTGSTNAKGYGSYTIGVGRTGIRAHRAAYEVLTGPIPEGADLDHLCRNPSCVNPWHLEPVSRRENLMRGSTLAAENAGKTFCINRHRFTPGNTYVTPNGRRQCRTCLADRNRAYRARKAAELSA